MTPIDTNQLIEIRVQGIIDWIRANKFDIAKEEKAEITINMCGKKMQGKITTYPKWQD